MKSQKNNNGKLKVFLTVIAFFVVIIAVKAQGVGVPGGGSIDDTTPAPIDGLIGLVMMAGAFFLWKKALG